MLNLIEIKSRFQFESKYFDSNIRFRKIGYPIIQRDKFSIAMLKISITIELLEFLFIKKLYTGTKMVLGYLSLDLSLWMVLGCFIPYSFPFNAESLDAWVHLLVQKWFVFKIIRNRFNCLNRKIS